MLNKDIGVELALDVSPSDLSASDADLADAAERDEFEGRGEDVDRVGASWTSDRNDGRVR